MAAVTHLSGLVGLAATARFNLTRLKIIRAALLLLAIHDASRLLLLAHC